MNRPRLSPLLRLQFLGFLMLLGLGALGSSGSGGCKSRAGRNGPRAFAVVLRPRCAFRPFAARSRDRDRRDAGAEPGQL